MVFLGIYSNFLRRLSPVISTQTALVPVLSITATQVSTIKIQDDQLTVSNGTAQKTFALDNYTIQSLSNALNAVSGIFSTVLGYGNISSVLLIDASYPSTTDATLYADVSDNAVLLKSMTYVLKTQFQDMQNGILQLNPYAASSLWLDYFGEFMGVPRYQGEPDQLYANRIVALRVGIRDNNVAIEQFLAKMGYSSRAIDTGLGYASIYINIPKSEPTGFVYSFAHVQDMVNVLKPLGVQVTVHLSGTLADGIKIADSISYTLRSTPWTWGNFVWGQFNW